jgi:integrase
VDGLPGNRSQRESVDLENVRKQAENTRERKPGSRHPAIGGSLECLSQFCRHPSFGVMFHSGGGDPMDLHKLAQLVIRPVVELIELEWYGWHGFRRGIASNLYELGADEKIVQRVLRHAKAHVTKDRYIKAFDPVVLAAMKRMETTLAAMKVCAPTVHQIN